MKLLVLDRIVIDAELQPRAKINRAVLDNYVQLLVDGAVFPPVMVFRTDEGLLLADGFHRWHAHKVLGLDAIKAEVVDGTRRDALLYSLSANAAHGLQRAALDYKRAFEIACRYELVDATDAEAVAALLRCSGRTAERLTEDAREAVNAAARAARDAAILADISAGKSNRAIAKEMGISEPTVRRLGCASSPPLAGVTHSPSQPVETEQPSEPETSDEPEATDEPDTPTWRRQLEELASEPAQNWSAALRALRHINEQVSVDALFDKRFVGFDHAFEPQLLAAFQWITELRGRFEDERNYRRRA